MLTAVTGINWGDEGKGRVIDLLAENADIVARYQGGNNAGHTVVTEKGKFILNLLPSGILHPEVTCVLGTGMVIDLEHLAGEMEAIEARGVKVEPENLKLSDKATISMPWHKVQDGLEEDRLAQKGSAAGEVLAAKGEQLRKGCDGSYKMPWRKFEPPTPYVRKDGTMDFATVDFVDMVKMGQPVAIYTPAVKGRDGKTVDGNVIEEVSGKDLPPLKGKDIAVHPDKVTYVARKDGYVIFDENKYTIDIQDVLVIKGNVNRLYGNVFYDGTVRVKGNVGEGAIISAKGDVIVEGYIQSAYVSAGNNVVVIGGVNANDSGYISAQGGVYAEYLENAVVYAGQDVKANYILTSRIEAGTEITVKGSKGVICGGELTAGCKITAQNLGNRGFVKTIITVGMNEKMKERLIAAKTFKAETERDINTLKKGAEHLRHSLSPAELDKNDMYIKLGIAVQMKEQSLSRVNDDINEIESWIHNTDRVSVNVLGTAYPNSEIHINEVTRLLDSDIFNVTFLQAGDTIITKKFI